MAHLSLAAEPQFFRGASVQSRALGFGVRHTIRPLLGLWARLPFDVFPPNAVDHIARLLPVHAGTKWRTVDLSDCKSEWLQAKGVEDVAHGTESSKNVGAILYFHGGAFLTCGLNTHRRLVSNISHASGQPVLNVGYRQMPYEPITESIADGVDGFRWLMEQGYQPENITIAGDSAGGYLAFSVARVVMDRGWGRPAGVVAISPLLDFDPTARGERWRVVHSAGHLSVYDAEDETVVDRGIGHLLDHDQVRAEAEKLRDEVLQRVRDGDL